MLSRLLGEGEKTVKIGVHLIIIYMMMLFGPWMLLCLGIMGLVLIFCEKKVVRRVIKVLGSVILCIILWAFVNVIIYIIRYESMWYGIWLTLCLTVTVVTVIVQLINKKLLKKKPIHWAKKLAAYIVFYAITLFVLWKGLKPYLEPYPSNWLATDKEYRELAYELYNLELDCHGYEKVYEGSHGEIEITFIENRNWERTSEQRDYIAIKTVVEEYIKENRNCQGKRIDIRFYLGSGESQNHLYNFDPWTGEMGDDIPYWFVTDAHVNSCTELAELYHDFSGINAWVETLEDMQELTNMRNLTYLQLNVSGTVSENKALEEQYLEELNTLLPDCEIYLNQNNNTYPDWDKYSDKTVLNFL